MNNEDIGVQIFSPPLPESNCWLVSDSKEQRAETMDSRSIAVMLVCFHIHCERNINEFRSIYVSSQAKDF